MCPCELRKPEDPEVWVKNVVFTQALGEKVGPQVKRRVEGSSFYFFKTPGEFSKIHIPLTKPLDFTAR